MIEGVKIENEGPDGTYLLLSGDFVGAMHDYMEDEGEGTLRLQVSDEVLAQLDEALKPWRAHMAEGELIREEIEAHKRAGLCGWWIPQKGPCVLPAGHNEGHAAHEPQELPHE